MHAQPSMPSPVRFRTLPSLYHAMHRLHARHTTILFRFAFRIAPTGTWHVSFVASAYNPHRLHPWDAHRLSFKTCTARINPAPCQPRRPLAAPSPFCCLHRPSLRVLPACPASLIEGRATAMHSNSQTAHHAESGLTLQSNKRCMQQAQWAGCTTQGWLHAN